MAAVEKDKIKDFSMGSRSLSRVWDILAYLKGCHLGKYRDGSPTKDDHACPSCREDSYRYYQTLKPAFYPAALKNWFGQNTGKTLSLETPRTFNEKIQWLKLYDSTLLKTRLADKYLVRDWVREKIGAEYLTDLYGVWDHYDDIDFNLLPDRFVLKATHGSGWNIVVDDKGKLDQTEAKQKFDRWVHTNYAFVFGLELHYQDIVPRMIAEAFLENSGGDLYDYKIWCFHGRAEFIMFLAERQTRLKMAFYDRRWTPLPFTYLHPRYEKPVPRPDNLDEMIRVAESLSKNFAFVRVDLFRLDNGTLKFGEMTFTPASGTCLWNPPEYDEVLGRLIDIDRMRGETQTKTETG